jgi:hypothetical protein
MRDSACKIVKGKAGSKGNMVAAAADHVLSTNARQI